MKKIYSKGFTIIEMLIASMVFTTVLLLCMDGITRIAKLYIKNASISRTNEFTKSLIEDLSQQIRYGSSLPKIISPATSTDPWLLCISGYAYRIQINVKAASSVQKKSDPTCSLYSSVANFSDVDSVAPPAARILVFSVSNTGKVWDLNMRVALGDDDLMQDDTGKSPATSGVNLSNVKCKSGSSGGEFCAVIPLSTTVTRRMSGL